MYLSLTHEKKNLIQIIGNLVKKQKTKKQTVQNLLQKNASENT